MMNSWDGRRFRRSLFAAIGAVFLAAGYLIGIHSPPVDAADEKDKSSERKDDKASPADEALKKKHDESLRLMRERAALIKVHVLGEESDSDLIGEPLMRFDNQRVRNVDATLWGWTSQGRLVGVCKIVRMERLLSHERPWLYCFTSLSEDRIDARFAADRRFLAEKPGIELKAIENGPPPGEGLAVRLRQMKELANRFTATIGDDVLKTREELRLLPRPIYRYEKPAGAVLDGAVFSFAIGSAPNALLMIELHQTEGGAAEWKFAAAGSTWGRLAVKLDDNEVWTKPFVQRPGNYENWSSFWEE
jgi:hypothetical protein